MPVNAYTLADVARICRVAPARLRYWKRTALLEPRGVADARPAFGFRDLVGVKTVVDLLDRGVPLRRIRHSVQTLRERVPGLDRPLEALCVWPENSERVVARDCGRLFEPDGQLMLDFSQARPAGREVARLEELRRRNADAQEPVHSALDSFERGCELDSDRATYGEAIEAYVRAIEVDPDFADAHCNLGSVYFNQDRRSAAKACFARAIELQPRHLEAHLNLGTLLEEEGCNTLALQHYKVAFKTDPLSADTQVSLALVYDKLGLRRKGREHWRRYLQIAPEGAWAEMACKRLDA